MFHRWTKS